MLSQRQDCPGVTTPPFNPALNQPLERIGRYILSSLSLGVTTQGLLLHSLLEVPAGWRPRCSEGKATLPPFPFLCDSLLFCLQSALMQTPCSQFLSQGLVLGGTQPHPSRLFRLPIRTSQVTHWGWPFLSWQILGNAEGWRTCPAPFLG